MDLPTIVFVPVVTDEKVAIVTVGIENWPYDTKELEQYGRKFATFLYNNVPGSFVDAVKDEYLRLEIEGE